MILNDARRCTALILRGLGNRQREVRRLSGSLCVLSALLFWCSIAEVRAEPVDLELVLGIDCSYSVDANEFALQRLGLGHAFRSPEVVAAIAQGPRKAIAVTVVLWSSATSQVVAIPWTRVDDAASAAALAARLEGTPRLTDEGATSISAMIRFGLTLFGASPLQGERRTIDIASDGRNNSGGRVRVMRALAQAEGVTVNGLAILNEEPTLNYYFENQVITGPNAFVIKADDYSQFEAAIKRKLIREIGNQPIA